MQSNLEPRVLQNGSTSNNTSGPPSARGPDVFEFLGFVAWYLFLVMCCIVPTICAYQRRRRMNAEQQQRRRQEVQIYLTNFHFPQRMERVEEDEVILARDALQKTTMLVESKHLVKRNDGSANLPTESIREEDKEDAKEETRDSEADVDVEMAEMATTEYDLYLVDDSEREFSHLTLPEDSHHGARMVPAACAICLCPYEVGDEVSWSPESECQHAFHRDCITSWLSKKRQQLCPCCRQVFCRVEETPPANDGSTVVESSEGGMRPFGAQYPPAVEPANVRGMQRYHLNI